MRVPFRWRFTVSVLIAVVLGLALAGWLVLRSVERFELARLQESLERHAKLVATAVQPLLEGQRGSSQLLELQALGKRLGRQVEARITTIAPDGSVLADSETPDEAVARLENHRDRPEVNQAITSGLGANIRHSQTTGKRMLYCAVPIRSSGDAGPLGVARISLPLTTVEARIGDLQGVLVAAFGAALLVSLLLGLLMARGLTRPLGDLVTLASRLAAGQLSERVRVTAQDEIGILGRTLNQMAERLDATLKEVSEDRTQLLAVLGSMVEGVMVLDCQGSVLQVNPALELMFAVRLADIKGRPYAEVLRHVEFESLVQRLLKTRECSSGEIMLSPIGNILKIEASFARSEQEGEPCAVLVFHDVTALRRLEKVRKDFVANVSHELRTPLTSIKGYVEALLDGAKDDPDMLSSFLRIVLTQADRLNLILADLLQLSGIESGQIAFRREPVDLHEVMARTMTVMKPLAEKKSHTLTLDLAKEAPVAWGDEDRLVQVMTNLIDNAVKYTPEGGSIGISVRHVHCGGDGSSKDMVEIVVADTGIGIPETDRPRVFERFYRVDKARSRELGGTGLGLSIVKHIVEAHGGEVWVEPNTPIGSRFVVHIPCGPRTA